MAATKPLSQTQPGCDHALALHDGMWISARHNRGCVTRAWHAAARGAAGGRSVGLGSDDLHNVATSDIDSRTWRRRYGGCIKPLGSGHRTAKRQCAALAAAVARHLQAIGPESTREAPGSGRCLPVLCLDPSHQTHPHAASFCAIQYTLVSLWAMSAVRCWSVVLNGSADPRNILAGNQGEEKPVRPSGGLSAFSSVLDARLHPG